MRADPDTLAKKLLGMPTPPGAGVPEEPTGDDDAPVDAEGAAIESAAEEAAEAMGLPAEKASALASFAQTILRLARES